MNKIIKSKITVLISFIGTKDLKNITNSKNFQRSWNVIKDITDVCRNCEFRYMCVDNRPVYKRVSDSLYYHKEECNYNPFISKWRGQENYLTLKECGIISDENGFKLNKKQLNLISKTL